MTKTRSQLHRERARWKAGDTVTVPDYRPPVVAWYARTKVGGSIFAHETRACVQRWIDLRNDEQAAEGVSACYRWLGPFPLIDLSTTE